MVDVIEFTPELSMEILMFSTRLRLDDVAARKISPPLALAMVMMIGFEAGQNCLRLSIIGCKLNQKIPGFAITLIHI